MLCCLRYILDLKNKTNQKAIASNELTQTQDIDVHKLVEAYERDQDIKFPVKGTNKSMDKVDEYCFNFSCYSSDVNKYCPT